MVYTWSRIDSTLSFHLSDNRYYKGWEYFLSTAPFSGFRRVKSYSGCGPLTVVNHGIARKGDVFGWWIWYDIAAALSLLTTVDALGTITSSMRRIASVAGTTGFFSPKTYAFSVFTDALDVKWNAATYNSYSGEDLNSYVFGVAVNRSTSALNYKFWGSEHIEHQLNYSYRIPSVPNGPHPTMSALYKWDTVSDNYYNPLGIARFTQETSVPNAPVAGVSNDLYTGLDSYDGNPLHDTGLNNEGYPTCYRTGVARAVWDFTNSGFA